MSLGSKGSDLYVLSNHRSMSLLEAVKDFFGDLLKIPFPATAYNIFVVVV